MSVATTFKGLLQGKNIEVSYVCIDCRFLHGSRTERLSRKRLWSYVASETFVEVCHISCVDTDVLKLVLDVRSTKFVVVTIPGRLLALLRQL